MPPGVVCQGISQRLLSQLLERPSNLFDAIVWQDDPAGDISYNLPDLSKVCNDQRLACGQRLKKFVWRAESGVGVFRIQTAIHHIPGTRVAWNIGGRYKADITNAGVLCRSGPDHLFQGALATDDQVHIPYQIDRI